MGLGRKIVLITVGFFTTLYLLGVLSSLGLGILALVLAFTIGPLVPLIVHYMSRPTQQRVFPTGMSFAKFLGLLQIIALIAILYSPSSLRIPLGNAGTNLNVNDSFQSIQGFTRYLESNYHHVFIANNSIMLAQELNIPGPKAYFFIGPDTGHALSQDDVALISRTFINGNLSMLIAEGNETNNYFLQNMFHVSVHGNAIIDHNSPFIDQRVFPVTVNLDSGPVLGVIDIAGPIYHENISLLGSPMPTPAQYHMRSVAKTSGHSTEASTIPNHEYNNVVGPRSVVETETLNNSRALLISDSSPFSQLYNYTFPQLGINETVFTNTLVSWTIQNNPNTTIILDNYHYLTISESVSPSLAVNLSIGHVFAGALAIFLSTANNSYDGFLADSRPFIIALALLTTWSLYGGLVRKYATEKRGKDDQALPIVERTVVAESEHRQRFLATVRDKQFYVAGLHELHQVLDGLTLREFGAAMNNIQTSQLVNRLGPDLAIQTRKLFDELGKISRYATHEKRYLFPPPILGWKRYASRLTFETEQFLNQLGVTMTGKDVRKKGLDYKTRRL